VIGALTTYAELARSPLVRRGLPILAEASREGGSPQIQNRGTIGRNVANASPAGDTLPVLAVADSVIVLRSVDAERRVAVRLLLHGLPADGDAPDELIAAIDGRVPPPGVGELARAVLERQAPGPGQRA
jgi:CO/xanthine dehydrogenase FAD-binding subunit